MDDRETLETALEIMEQVPHATILMEKRDGIVRAIRRLLQERTALKSAFDGVRFGTGTAEDPYRHEFHLTMEQAFVLRTLCQSDRG